MMDKAASALFFWAFGSFCGISTLSILNVSKDTELMSYRKQITQCEQTLPRNESCVLVAVPKKENK